MWSVSNVPGSDDEKYWAVTFDMLRLKRHIIPGKSDCLFRAFLHRLCKISGLEAQQHFTDLEISECSDATVFRNVFVDYLLKHKRHSDLVKVLQKRISRFIEVVVHISTKDGPPWCRYKISSMSGMIWTGRLADYKGSCIYLITIHVPFFIEFLEHNRSEIDAHPARKIWKIGKMQMMLKSLNMVSIWPLPRTKTFTDKLKIQFERKILNLIRNAH